MFANPKLIPPLAGTLWMHTDGGMYMVNFLAVDTTTREQVVVYEHLWPFEEGSHYTRPTLEFAVKFVALQPYAVHEIRHLDVVYYQKLVTERKTARKAKEEEERLAEARARTED